MTTEVEFKFRVEGPEAFDALRRALGLPAGAGGDAVRQVNHFFDTTDQALRANDLALRLREEDGRFLLTVKGKERRRADALAERFEEEWELEADEARALLAGDASTETVLERRAPGSAAQRHVDAACAGAEVARVGSFENERTRLPALDLGPGLRHAVFELDRTLFPGGRVDHEIELEVEATDAELEAARALLGELLERAGIAWTTAPGKAARFFALLDAGGRG